MTKRLHNLKYIFAWPRGGFLSQKAEIAEVDKYHFWFFPNTYLEHTCFFFPLSLNLLLVLIFIQHQVSGFGNCHLDSWGRKEMGNSLSWHSCLSLPWQPPIGCVYSQEQHLSGYTVYVWNKNAFHNKTWLSLLKGSWGLLPSTQMSQEWGQREVLPSGQEESLSGGVLNSAWQVSLSQIGSQVVWVQVPALRAT